MQKGLDKLWQWQPGTTSPTYAIEAVSSCSPHTSLPNHLALVYFSFSDLIRCNSGLHRFNPQMKNEIWHLFFFFAATDVLWMAKLFNEAFGGAARHWLSLNTWDRLRGCNKLCCSVRLRTELMCGDFTFHHYSGLGFNNKHSCVPVTLPKQVFMSHFMFHLWSVYLTRYLPFTAPEDIFELKSKTLNFVTNVKQVLSWIHLLIVFHGVFRMKIYITLASFLVFSRWTFVTWQYLKMLWVINVIYCVYQLCYKSVYKDILNLQYMQLFILVSNFTLNFKVFIQFFITIKPLV